MNAKKTDASSLQFCDVKKSWKVNENMDGDSPEEKLYLGFDFSTQQVSLSLILVLLNYRLFGVFRSKLW